jgi:uncharacterized protein (TIGR00255 family)
VTLDLGFPDPSSWDVNINEGLLEKIFTSLDRISERLNRDVNLSVDNIFRIPQIVELKRKDLSRSELAFLERGFARTLEDVVKSRRDEGAKTAGQIKRHLLNVNRAVQKIEKLLTKQPRLIQRKLRQRLKDMNGQSPHSEEKLSEEVAYLSQRYDVSEEIQRLKSHVDAALGLITSRKGEPAGKMLDFLAQELYREANTLNSKSQDIGITKEGLLIKGEVESVRQQVQNLE